MWAVSTARFSSDLRRCATALGLTVSISLLAISVLASSWEDKDWKQWSKADCERLLEDSPWAHTWRGGGPEGNLLAYSVQLRSALPIRNGIVRSLQFDQKYEKMNDAQRTEFDAQTAQILNRNYDDIVLVHVDFSKSSVAAFLQGNLNAIRAKDDSWSASLIRENGTAIAATRFDPKKNYSFDVIFPRPKLDRDAAGERTKRLTFQFQSPELNNVTSMSVTVSTVPARPISVEFDLEKMTYKGKLEY